MTENSIGNASQANMNEWFTPGRFAFLLGFLVCASFPQVIMGSGAFYLRDFSLFSEPLAYYQRECFWRGELPLWTPMNCCGLPFLAEWNTLSLYPPALFYLLLPFSWALGVFCLGHVFLGGMGMYFLAHRWTGNRFAASVGGVAFAFTAVMLNFLMWPGNVAAMGWLPWVVLTLERAWRMGGRALITAAMAGALQMLAGAPEVVMQTWGFLAALFLFEWVRERQVRGQMLLRFVVVVCLIASLAAAQLLPFLDLLAHSHRDTGYGDSTWAMPLWGWANYLVPLFGCTASVPGIYSQPGQYWIFSYYLGIGTTAFAALAVWQKRQPKVWLLAGVTLLCLLLALGDRGGVFSVLRKVVPVLGFMRYPVKFVILPAFIVPLLAAMFVAQTLACTGENWLRLRRRIWIAGIAATAAVGLILFAAAQWPIKKVSWVEVAESGASRVFFLVLILFLLSCLRRPGPKARHLLLRAALCLLIWLDVPTMGSRLSPTVAPSVYEPGLVRRENTLQPAPMVGESRALMTHDVADNLIHLWFTNAADQVVYNRLALNANANLLDAIPKVTGVYPLLTREMNDIVWLLSDPSVPPTGLLDFLSVAQLNVPGRATEWNFRPTHLPWVTGGQKPVFADADRTLNALAQSEFNPRTTVYLAPDAKAGITVTNMSAPKVSTRDFGRTQILVDVEAKEPALIVIGQNYYHNWQVFVDDRRSVLLRANHAFQAVEVPAGRHQVRLIYRDSAFLAGAGLSLATLLGCAMYWWRKRGTATVSPLPS